MEFIPALMEEKHRVSRLTDLIAQVKAKDPQIGQDLEAEFRAISGRRSFGLNFERHKPEEVDLPGRPVRRGDQVRVLPPRGSTEVGDQGLWKVLKTEKVDGQRVARLQRREGETVVDEVALVEDLVVVAGFGDAIYPGLVETGRVERGEVEDPYHTVINAENYHALRTLTYTHRGKVDCIYIDPPYNTGDKSWKYNNHYVEGDDLYRHSKWLAFMERRLKVARELLNPLNSVLIVTIDEKEYARLALLLEQTFPEGRVQMVSVVINPSGTSRDLLSRVDEYAFFVFLGDAAPSRHLDNLLTTVADEAAGLTWESLLRRGNAWYQRERPNLCYPVLIDESTGQIAGTGDIFRGGKEEDRPTEIDGYFAAWPVRTDGRLGIWRKDAKGLMALAERGYAFASSPDPKRGTWSLKYLMSGTVDAIEAGDIIAERTGHRGQVEGKAAASRSVAKTVWMRAQHNAGMHGSALLRALIPGRTFPFPKSLYAVEDALRVAVGDKPTAVVLDFFSGSGTTAHAVMRLNRQDGGQRSSISVTNNEVSAEEQFALRRKGLRPGDEDWETLGICDHITKPRVTAAITGETPEGTPVKGDYKFTDTFPMAEGFQSNARFFTLTYETPISVSHNRAFARIAPLLWLRAGAVGAEISTLPEAGWAVVDAYGLLSDLDAETPFLEALEGAQGVRIAYIVTDDAGRFESISSRLPAGIEPVRLYESYLTNLSFLAGE